MESDDRITLRAHLEAMLKAMENRLDQRINDLAITAEKRAQDADIRYEQRFKTQAEAVLTAMAASEKAITAAMTAAEKAISAAMSAAEKAVTKAELAADKRFESVNEFRRSLDDMVRNLLPRGEAESRFGSLSEKVDGILSRIDTMQGAGAGMKASWGILTASIAAIVGVIVIYAALSK